MIIPTTELFSSLQSAVADGSNQSLELDLMKGDAQSHPAQNFDATLDETLSNEKVKILNKECDSELDSAGPDPDDSVRLVRSPMTVRTDQSLKVQAESRGVDAILDLNDQPVRQVDKLEVGNLLQVNSSSADATTLDKARVVTAEQTVQVSKQEKAVQASVESPVRQWPLGEKRTQASDTGLEKAAVRVETKSMGSEQKMAVAVDADSGRFSKNGVASSSEPDAGAATRSQEKTPNNRQVQAGLLDRKSVVHRKLTSPHTQEMTSNSPQVLSERLDKETVVHQKLASPHLQNHLMDKAQSKHVSGPGDRVEKKQTPLVLKSPVETTRASNSSTITAKQPSMRAQRSQNDLPVALTQQKNNEPSDSVRRSVERAPAFSKSNLMPDIGDALSAVRHNSDSLDHQSHLNRAEPVHTSKPPQMSQGPMDTMMPDSPSGSERSKVERTASTVERSGKLIRQFNHKGLTEASNRQTSQSVSPSINFEGRSSVVATDGQERVLKDPNSIMVPKIDARQLEASVDIQKIDLNKRVEKLNQQTNQFKVQMSTAGQSSQISSASSPVHEPVLNVRQQKHFNRSSRKTDDRAVRPVLQASSESMHPISDSRQTNIGLPSRVGQVAKTDMSMLEQSLIEDSKQGKDRVNEMSDKASRHEAKFDKLAQAGGFLESNHSQSVSTNKGTTATLNQSTPVLMQRMLDTIQDLKQSQNAQRVSFELDLAQGEKLKVRLQLSGDQVKSIFTTDSNTMKHLIRDNWDQLQRQVESEGFDLAQPDFTDRNPQQANDSDEQTAANEFFQADTKPSESLDHSKKNSN
jgi:hypothetical protein